MRFVGLVGYKQSGKTTVLKYLEKNYDAQEIMLAGHLKDVCAEVFNLPRVSFEDQNLKEKPFKKLNYPSLIIALVFLMAIAGSITFWALGNRNKEFYPFHVANLIFCLPMFVLIFAFNFYEGIKDYIHSYSIPLNIKLMLACLKKFEIKPNYRITDSLNGKILKTPREIAQIIGSELLREHNPNCHIEWAIRKASNAQLLIASDVRFPNEFEFFAGQGGLMIHIDRKSAAPKEGETPHMSESHIRSLGRKCDIRIDNNGTFEELHEQLSKIKQKIGVRI